MYSSSPPVWIGSADFFFCRNSFPKLLNFHNIFTQLGKFWGGGQCRKACRSRKKVSKPSEITWKQSEPVRSISKIEKRRKFVRALLLLLLLSLYWFNSTPEPRMYLDHERNCTGDISPSWGQPNTKVYTVLSRRRARPQRWAHVVHAARLEMKVCI